MIFEFAGDVVSGGWDAVKNITAGIGQGASTLVGGFFPAPQKEKTQHLEIEQAGGTGQTYRPTAPDSPSIFETAAMAANEWLDSPYEEIYSPTRSGTTSLEQAIKKTQPKPDPLKSITDIFSGFGKLTTGVLEAGQKIRTAADEFMEMWGLTSRETIKGKPRAGYPEGKDEQHLNDLRSMGAAVVQTMKGYGENFVNQIKGLFSLGYPSESQPAFAIKHELQPSAKTTTGLIIAAVIIIILVFVSRKK